MTNTVVAIENFLYLCAVDSSRCECHRRRRIYRCDAECVAGGENCRFRHNSGKYHRIVNGENCRLTYDRYQSIADTFYCRAAVFTDSGSYGAGDLRYSHTNAC